MKDSKKAVEELNRENSPKKMSTVELVVWTIIAGVVVLVAIDYLYNL